MHLNIVKLGTSDQNVVIAAAQKYKNKGNIVFPVK